MNRAQLIFDFPAQQNRFGEEDFIFAAENKNAVDFLTKFFTQKSFINNSFPSFILKGEHACGKTHLLHIFAHKFQAIFLTKEHLNSLDFFTENNFYILENIETIEEKTLLHTINSAIEAKAFLILSTDDFSCFTLIDLVSRLKNIFTIEIKNPSTDLVKILLSQKLSQKQLRINGEVLEFLASHLRPSYAVIDDTLKMIEFYCHENKKSFTLAEAKKLILG